MTTTTRPLAIPAPTRARDVFVWRPPEATFGVRWGLSAAVVAGVVVAVVAIRCLRALLWDEGVIADGALLGVVSHGSLLWALPAASCALGLLGMLLYRERADAVVDIRDPMRTEVCFRIVTRGQNVEAVRATVTSVRLELALQPLFPYRIEVVTDRPLPLDSHPDLTVFVVPPSYTTPHGAQFKARALQYALDHSTLPNDAWLFHLDEESHVTSSVVAGIRDAVADEEQTGRHRIGQGLILYHRDLDAHPFLTLADMIRTGDDVGRFHLQHRLGVTLFGLHGSFILVRNSVERTVGFDFGPEGSITEDAFWALRQMNTGGRCRWVRGHIVEQSPRSAGDFVRQRRRWFSGMVRVVLYADVQRWIRVPLGVFTAVWAVSWLTMLYTIANLVLGLRTNTTVAALGDFALAVYVVTYITGLAINLRARPDIPLSRRARLYVAQVVLLPAFSVLEAAGVVLGVVKPERGFHVVAK